MAYPYNKPGDSAKIRGINKIDDWDYPFQRTLPDRLPNIKGKKKIVVKRKLGKYWSERYEGKRGDTSK